MSNRKLLVVSIDCMTEHDLHRGEMPNYRLLMERGTKLTKMESIFPTVTYPAHSTIMSGCLPSKTRVFSNEVYDPGNPFPDWLWWEKSNRAFPLYRALMEKGYTVGLSHWPVTGGAKVTVNMTEIWPNLESGDGRAAYLAAGANPKRESELFDANKARYGWRNHPAFDEMAHAFGRAMVGEDRLDAVFVHSAYLDAAHHRSGLNGEETLKAIAQEDRWLGMLMDLVKKNGDWDNTLIVALSDHGCVDYTKIFKPNVLMERAGLCKTARGGEVKARAWCYSGGGSCLVRVENPLDREKVKSLLDAWALDPRYGVDHIFDASVMTGREPYDFDYVIEMKEGFSVSNAYGEAEPVQEVPTRATHGYLARKGAQPLAVFAGPGIKKGAVLEGARLWDLAPTIAKWMGVELPEADGKALDIFA